ncbi:hypothetical protein KUCAC02_009264 [Chaenocephalus aceratus]|uniref:Uncharacterized protein n=1 Tax=Chaenocephalus aceratus TaxID=36190 RepID=A0ACB9WUH1_CHAAC|nr:hypothetical protein KUCAC02_009264 [Chaenocephalus aceratus]
MEPFLFVCVNSAFTALFFCSQIREL